jgi:hypothetical protein
MVSLDADPGVELANNNSLYFRSHQLRPVEDLVLDKVAWGELRRRLTGQQARYLSLRLRGYSVREVNALMGVNQWGGTCLREEIKRQARDILQEA